MCKVIMKEKETNDIFFEKKFTDVNKAKRLKETIEKYTNRNKISVDIV